MKYTLIYSKRVQHKIKNIRRDVAVRIIKKLEELAEEESPHLCVKRLTNSPLYSLRVGSYRVILAIEHQQLVIMAVDVDHRKNIYNDL